MAKDDHARPQMTIAVVGGGPAGLYFALLTKKARPDWRIEVFEQNQADDTFGFGVVFSDETLDEFLSRDPESYAAICDRFAYWDDIVIDYKGEQVRCGGNGFAGCSRIALLNILQARCVAVGVELHFGHAVEDLTSLDGYDIVVGADGVNSRIRDRNRELFRPTIAFKRNKFAWLGSTRQLDAFTYFFKETQHGVICAHTYQYEADGSTWVIEMSPETWRGHGFDALDEQASATKLEHIFAEALDGHPLIINRSTWRNFPRISCKRWWHGNTVLIGDAKASAHFSIGSGSKMAMECAIALADAVLEYGERNVADAFRAYELARKTPIQVTQHNADVSLDWFEHMDRSFDMKPMQFAMVVMCRSKSITWDNLMVRDHTFVERFLDEWLETYEAEEGFDVTSLRPPPMFTPLKLRSVTLTNRVVVSPMAQYRAVEGAPTDWHFAHYAARGLGGAGLIFTEMTCPSPEARITPGCTGLWNDAQEAGWRRIIDFIHQESASKICLQLGHAGRKGSTQVGWERMDHPLPQAEQNWPLVSASPIPWFEGESAVPAPLDRDGMEKVTETFVQSAVRAARAGFDMLELHCAHGYLLASFLSPLTNIRTDAYGGTIENRLRFPLEVFLAVRDVWPADKPMSVRVSASDWAPGGLTDADLFAIAQAFQLAGCDLLDASTGQTLPTQKPVYGRMYQVPYAEAVRNVTGLRTMTVGAVTEPGQINTLIACRRADLVALARPHLIDPSFTRRAAGWYGLTPQDTPLPYLSGEDQARREGLKARARQEDLQRRAKPKRHAAPVL